jgi:hypothetical protein
MRLREDLSRDSITQSSWDVGDFEFLLRWGLSSPKFCRGLVWIVSISVDVFIRKKSLEATSWIEGVEDLSEAVDRSPAHM